MTGEGRLRLSGRSLHELEHKVTAGWLWTEKLVGQHSHSQLLISYRKLTFIWGEDLVVNNVSI